MASKPSPTIECECQDHQPHIHKLDWYTNIYEEDENIIVCNRCAEKKYSYIIKYENIFCACQQHSLEKIFGSKNIPCMEQYHCRDCNLFFTKEQLSSHYEKRPCPVVNCKGFYNLCTKNDHFSKHGLCWNNEMKYYKNKNYNYYIDHKNHCSNFCIVCNYCILDLKEHFENHHKCCDDAEDQKNKGLLLEHQSKSLIDGGCPNFCIGCKKLIIRPSLHEHIIEHHRCSNSKSCLDIILTPSAQEIHNRECLYYNIKCIDCKYSFPRHEENFHRRLHTCILSNCNFYSPNLDLSEHYKSHP